MTSRIIRWGEAGRRGTAQRRSTMTHIRWGEAGRWAALRGAARYSASSRPGYTCRMFRLQRSLTQFWMSSLALAHAELAIDNQESAL